MASNVAGRRNLGDWIALIKESHSEFCTKLEDCYRSGGTTFSLYFPPAQ